VRERMGSGGPRGLQILRSGASRVRGGFDSHAFPPFPIAALLALTLALAPPRAAHAAAAADSVRAAQADTVGQGAAQARQRAERWSEQPRSVMLRSLVLPGWGQFHNHAWIKCAAVAGGEWWIIGSLLGDRRSLDRLVDQANAALARGDEADYTAIYNRYTEVDNGFVAHQWLLGGVLAYALIDAYVDAHFRSFEIEFKTDPALPQGIPPDVKSPGGSTGKSARLSLRWDF